MSTLMFGWVRAALLGSVFAGLAACGSSGTPGGTTTGRGDCTPGKQEECACPGGTKGVQTCNSDGAGLSPCECGSTTGTGGAGGTSTGTMGPMCGDGIQQAGECDPTSEGHIYCAPDCDSMTATSSGTGGAGGSCAGQLSYAGPAPAVGAVWAAGGLTGLPAGNYMCQNAMLDADHVCDYEEVLAAQKAGELANITAGTTAWVQRTTPALVNGVMSPPGPGGRCNDWKYNTNHISDGEYVTFDMVGQPTFHLDNDTVFDGLNPGVHVIPGDLECNGATRAILCCFAACK